MFSSQSISLYGDDLFNFKGLRNADNTEECTYNCGGYALGTFSWYLPHDEPVWGGGRSVRWNREKMERITRECVENMLDDFSDLRVITDLHEVCRNEYAIAFRVSSDGDFHYARHTRFHTWTHKRGAWIIDSMTRKEILTTEWCGGRYNGPIVLFAKKKNNSYYPFL